jgi:hypothetical protein
VLVTGGTTVNGQGTFTGNPALDAEILDVRASRWTVGSEIPTSDRFTLLQGVTLLKDGRILAMIVYLGTPPTTAAYAYDPIADFWSEASIPPRLSFYANAVTLTSGRVLLVAGQEAAEYDPAIAAPTSPARGPFDSTKMTLYLAIGLGLVLAAIFAQRTVGRWPKEKRPANPSRIEPSRHSASAGGRG